MDKVQVEKTLEEFLSYIDPSADFSVSPIEENLYDVQIEGPELSFLIGYHGKTLDAFQHLLNLFLYTQSPDGIHINLDINEYKEKRKEKLHEITKKYIDKVRFFDKEIHMSAMSPWERKQVHLLIGEYPDIETESTDEGEARHIVLRKKI